LPALLARKCAHRGVAFESLASFFPERLMTEVARSWARDLGPFLPILPAREKVLDELRALLREHLLIPQGS
jgi:hypothetical protein